MDFLPASDPRLAATLAISERALDAGTGDLFYRYRFDDGLPGQEGAFAACTFWLAGLHAMAGDHGRSAELVTRMLGRANDVGLFAEQIAPDTGEQIGNFPQSFTHMALIHEVTRSSALAQRAGSDNGATA
jgi:GH15 family glucan-1,4-alpha-glucosidase